jgi:hypothetical protein
VILSKIAGSGAIHGSLVANLEQHRSEFGAVLSVLQDSRNVWPGKKYGKEKNFRSWEVKI